MIYDALIIGRGLAGAVLAETLLQRGLSVHVFDQPRSGSASRAAAGVVNPVVLRRDIPSWRAAELLPLARSFYTDWQHRLGRPLWEDLPMVKVFPSPNEARQWHQAMQRPLSAPFLTRRTEPGVETAPLRAPHGYGVIPDGAWLRVPELLDAQGAMLEAQGSSSTLDVRTEAIEVQEDRVTIGDVQGRWLIRCAGPFGEHPGLVPVRGDTLLVRIPGLDLSCMVHRGVFLVPLGNELYRVGATFVWEDVWNDRPDAARELLLERLRAFVDAPLEVVGRTWGVRPASRDRRPLLGRTGPREAIFNGLGSRGVLLAPWCAAHLAAHLWDGAPLDPEVDHRRYVPGS